MAGILSACGTAVAKGPFPGDDGTVAVGALDPAADGPLRAGMRSGLLEGQLRYFGVLAPNARLREQVVQTEGPSPALLERLCEAAECMGIEEGGGLGE
jgi:hypothetical protein